MRLSAGDGSGTSRRGRDEIDYPMAGDIEYPLAEVDETGDGMDMERQSEHSSRHTSVAANDERDEYNSDDSYVVEATEDMDSDVTSSDSSDDFDVMVTRGQANRRKTPTSTAKPKATNSRKAKPADSSRSRPVRTTRAASVRF